MLSRWNNQSNSKSHKTRNNLYLNNHKLLSIKRRTKEIIYALKIPIINRAIVTMTKTIVKSVIANLKISNTGVLDSRLTTVRTGQERMEIKFSFYSMNSSFKLTGPKIKLPSCPKKQALQSPRFTSGTGINGKNSEKEWTSHPISKL